MRSLQPARARTSALAGYYLSALNSYNLTKRIPFPASLLAALICAARSTAAPLAWFPGPSLNDPMSGAATVVSGGINILTGGDAFQYYDYPVSYPESLAATNAYWTPLSPFDSLNIAPGAVVSDGNLVIYGGSDGTNSQSVVINYSLSGDTVPALPSMQNARSYLGYAPDRNGNAYAFGGLDASANPLASVEKLSLASDNNPVWTYVASMPTPLYDFPAVFNRTNYIYIFGGRTNFTDGTEVATVRRYSISGNSWTNLASMPVAVSGSAATLGSDGKIYVVGGISGGLTTDTVQVYDPIANSWSISTPLPEPLAHAALGVDSIGRLIIMGGQDANGNDVTDVWRSQQFSLPDTAPTFLSYPTNSAGYQVPYSSSITATGNPPATYLLVTGPAGMQVDLFTGAITWTPQADQVGTNAVTIRATNYAGYADWNFNVVVPNPPPTLVSNLIVLSATENSVTLAWDPEDPIAGAVTYRAWLRHVAHSPRGSGVSITYSQIGSTVAQPTITISGLAAGSSQTYYITATGPGGSSGYAGITATTLPAPTPNNPRVTGLTSQTISLAWDPPVGPVPVVSYSIIGVYNGVFVQYPLGYANIPGTTFTITGLSPGTVLMIGVSAFDAYGNHSAYTYLPSMVVNPAPAPAQLSGPAAASDGSGFQLTISQSGSILQTVIIQATANPADPASWTQIGSILPDTNPFTFTDADSAQFSTRFYRVISP